MDPFIRFAGIFSNHMLLQRERPVPVWGVAPPGAAVVVTFGGQTVETTADAAGAWRVTLAPLPASNEPSDLRAAVHDSESAVTAVVRDVLVGDLWLCAGQSNMEMGIGACGVPEEIAGAHFPQIRFCTAPREIAHEPQADLPAPAVWRACSPETLVKGGWGGFSAVAYFFGREIHREVGVPVGLLNLSWGATKAEVWMSESAVATVPDAADALAAYREQRDANHAARAQREAERSRWWREHDPGCPVPERGDAGWAAADLVGAVPAEGWRAVTLPAELAATGLGDGWGLVYFRREFFLPPGWEGRDLLLSLGPIDECDTTFVNGVTVGESFQRFHERRYRIPAALLRPGRNAVAVRVLDVGSFGGIHGIPEQLFVAPLDAAPDERVSLAGPWQGKRGPVLADLRPLPAGIPQEPDFPAALFNGMIAPLGPLVCRGVIWYQGESNRDYPPPYADLLMALIEDWRRSFLSPGADTADLPFFIVQLANYGAPAAEPPAQSAWAEIRAAQARVAATVADCALAVAIDIGEAKNIHPLNKREVGRRLALLALARTYGRTEIVCSGPVCESATPGKGGSVRLRFSGVSGGLAVREGDTLLREFAVSSGPESDRWFAADARIEGPDTVVVSCERTPRPTRVRYAWADNPVGANLVGGAGLPAVPFELSVESVDTAASSRQNP